MPIVECVGGPLDGQAARILDNCRYLETIETARAPWFTDDMIVVMTSREPETGIPHEEVMYKIPREYLLEPLYEVIVHHYELQDNQLVYINKDNEIFQEHEPGCDGNHT